MANFKQSNAYTVIFAIVLAVVLAFSLAFVSTSLSERQKKEVKLDKRTQILGALSVTLEEQGVKLSEMTKDEQDAFFDKRIKSVVVNGQGEPVQAKDKFGNEISAEKVNVKNQYKDMKAEMKGGNQDATADYYPVFMLVAEGNSEEVQAYVLPVYGNGLWDLIWGYVAVDGDYKEIIGAVFDHKGETPGLGARITDAEIQQRFQGKPLYTDGDFQPVVMVKGENNAGLKPYQVDGMAGATITANGLSDMMRTYLRQYKPYFDKKTKQS